jgi:hypothetical protein
MKRLAILIAVLLTLPLFAQKRRSVGNPEAASGTPTTIVCQGTVTDAATGAPIPFVRLTTGKGLQGASSRNGTFAFDFVSKGSDADITATRTGFQSQTIHVSGAGPHELNFRLESRTAATLLKTDGTTLSLDDDSVKFGYIVPFMGYQTVTGSDFYMNDGTRAKIPNSQARHITRLGITEPNAYCHQPGQRLLLELRDDTIHDATFVDSCYGYTIDLIARDHITGDVVYMPFTEVSEIAFP